ncbi:MAG: transposase [Planctomycetia bacterium]|nr:transposase [Planctomycetia bacterium]
MNTIRLKLFKVAARVVVSVRRVVLRLSSSCPLQDLWRSLVPRLRLIPPAPS